MEPQIAIAVAADIYDEHMDGCVNKTQTYEFPADVTIHTIMEVFHQITIGLTFSEKTWQNGLKAALNQSLSEYGG